MERKMSSASEVYDEYLHVLRDPDYKADFDKKQQESDAGGIRNTKTSVYCYLTPSGYADINAEKSDVTPLAIWEGFKESTTAHGLPRFNASKGAMKKMFWALMMTVVTGLLLFNFATITELFFSNPTGVTIKIEHKTELTFPAVTICNMNPVKKTSLQSSDIFGGASSTNMVKKKRKKRAVSCDSGWSLYGEHCYFVVNTVNNKDNAHINCQSMDGELLITEDASEMTFIASILPASSKQYWIGLTKISGVWTWSDGSSATYVNWATAPAGWGPCVAISSNGYWKDKACTNLYYSVCEKNSTFSADPTTDPATTDSPTTSTTVTTSTSVATTSEASSTAAPVSTSNAQTNAQTTTLTSTETAAATSTALPADDTTTSVDDYISSFNEDLYCTEATTTHAFGTHSPTVLATTTESSAVTDPQNLKNKCCCTCCLTSTYGMNCNTCGSPDLSGAATCAAQVVPKEATTETPTQTPSPATAPSTIPGSQYPERLQTTPEFQTIEQLTEKLANVDIGKKAAIGYQSEDMILDCQYSGYTCQLREFAHFYNAIHGNCYVFNSGWNDTKRYMKMASKAGRRYGLHLILNIIQDEYIVQGGGDTAGIRLVVHPQDRMPFPEDEGITLGPGHVTSIGMRQVLIKRVGPPYIDCISAKNNQSHINVYEELHPVVYSASACQKTCYQKHVITTCGCGDPYYPLQGAALSPTPVKACNSSNITEDDCRYEVMRKHNANVLTCDCQDSCADVTYSLEVSMGMWPSNIRKDSTLSKLASQIGTTFDINDPKAYKKNLLKFEIYFEEFNFETITEKASYTSVSYISDIGGALGLCIGFSILTVAEFLEIGMDYSVFLGSLLYKKAKNAGRRTT